MGPEGGGVFFPTLGLSMAKPSSIATASMRRAAWARLARRRSSRQERLDAYHHVPHGSPKQMQGDFEAIAERSEDTDILVP